jgi:hypothetical protein
MNRLSELQQLLLSGDIIEERFPTTIADITEKITYIGYFAKLKNENSPDGCIIKKITERDTSVSGTVNKVIRIEYAEGDNSSFSFAWANRENYKYRYLDK